MRRVRSDGEEYAIPRTYDGVGPSKFLSNPISLSGGMTDPSDLPPGAVGWRDLTVPDADLVRKF